MGHKQWFPPGLPHRPTAGVEWPSEMSHGGSGLRWPGPYAPASTSHWAWLPGRVWPLQLGSAASSPILPPHPFRLSCLSPSAPEAPSQPSVPHKQGSPGDISWLLAPGSLMLVWYLLHPETAPRCLDTCVDRQAVFSRLTSCLALLVSQFHHLATSLGPLPAPAAGPSPRGPCPEGPFLSDSLGTSLIW